MNQSVKECWKSVNMWRSYGQDYSGLFFTDSQCTESLHLHNPQAMHWIERTLLANMGMLSKNILWLWLASTAIILHVMVTLTLTLTPQCFFCDGMHWCGVPALFHAAFLFTHNEGPVSLLLLRTVDVTARCNTAIIANSCGGKVSLYHRKL